MQKKTIVVAMSGGVDSSVVAALLHNAGHNIIGITLQLYDHGTSIGKQGSCCAGQDIYDAKMVAEQLGFPHYTFDYESKFRQYVIDDFVDSYSRGETPLPCVRCNQSVKFRDLLGAAKELNADALATGHYVQKFVHNNHIELHKGASVEKDQSYFLFATTMNQLKHLIFPLGGYTKEHTRELASKFNLDIATKPDSQDICFVPNGNYREVVNKINPKANKCGKFMHIDGFELGVHQGIINYTIGQRKGLGISFKSPLYVIKIDRIQNIVYLGPRSSLVKTQFTLTDINWLAQDKDIDQLEVVARVRSAALGIRASLTKINSNKILVSLLEHETSITPGQACVFYEDSRVLGGGWITHDIQ